MSVVFPRVGMMDQFIWWSGVFSGVSLCLSIQECCSPMAENNIQEIVENVLSIHRINNL